MFRATIVSFPALEFEPWGDTEFIVSDVAGRFTIAQIRNHRLEVASLHWWSKFNLHCTLDYD